MTIDRPSRQRHQPDVDAESARQGAQRCGRGIRLAAFDPADLRLVYPRALGELRLREVQRSPSARG